MPRVTVYIVGLVLMLAVAASCAGCGSTPGQPATASPPGTPTARPSAKPSADPAAAMRATVRAAAARIMSDIGAAEQRGDVVDGVPVGQSSNPYDYVGISPVFTKLVALGKPALPAIVATIESSSHDGLREYLLAAAGAQIDGDVPSDGQSWSTGKEWARQYGAAH